MNTLSEEQWKSTVQWEEDAGCFTLNDENTLGENSKVKTFLTSILAEISLCLLFDLFALITWARRVLIVQRSM